MKLWEVIKALTEDPTKLFRKDSSFHVGFTTEGALGWKNENGAFKSYFTVREDHLLDDGWKLVRQPVTWQEAIQAWADGKTIKTQSDDGIRTYRKTSKGLQSVLGGVTKDELLNGNWYVED